MKTYEIDDVGAGKKLVRAKAKTRPGLALTVLAAAFESAGGSTSELDEKNERPFALRANDFGKLLGLIVTEAMRLGKEHGESYDDIRFTLITKENAEGTFIGRPAKGMSLASEAKTKDEVLRNEANEWEATVLLS